MNPVTIEYRAAKYGYVFVIEELERENGKIVNIRKFGDNLTKTAATQIAVMLNKGKKND